MNPPMPTGAAPGGAPPAAPAGEEDPFAMFRKQIAGLDGPGKKQALQAFEDSMFKIMQDNLSDVYAEVDGGDQQQPGAPPMTTEAKPPPAPAETSAPVIEDEYPMDPPDMDIPESGNTSSTEKYPWIKEEEAAVDRIRKTRGGEEPEQYENYALNDKWLDWRYKEATPQELQSALDREKPVLDQMIDDGETGGDAFYETEQLVKFLQNKLFGDEGPPGGGDGNGRPTGTGGRAMPLENDMEGMPKPRMTMMGRY